MCGRYLFSDEQSKEIQRIILEINDKHKNDSRTMRIGEVFPTNMVPVIINSNNKHTAELYKWGFPNFRQKSAVIINARGETIDEKQTFKRLIYTKRCLIPTTGFFEWKTLEKEKEKYLIRPLNHSFFYMAGLYNTFIDKEGTSYEGFVIITTEANEQMLDIHTRMPIILNLEEADAWLESSTNSLAPIKSFLHPFNEELSFNKVS